MIPQQALALNLAQLKVDPTVSDPYINPNFDELVDLDTPWIIQELKTKRKKALMSDGIKTVLMKLNSDDADYAERGLKDLIRSLSTVETRSNLTVDFKSEMSDIISTLKVPKNETAHETGYFEIDQATGGLQPGWLVLLAALPKIGKCFAKGTKILMYDGSVKNVEDIKDGELVMGDDSTARTVSGSTHNFEKMYTIVPNKGEPFTVNASHILALRRTGTSDKKGDIPGDPNLLEITVRDYLQDVKKYERWKLYKTGVDFKSQPISKYLPPRLLGMWLGDGSSRDPEFTFIDKELQEYIGDIATSFGASISKRGTNSSASYSIRFKHPGKGQRYTHSNLVWNELRRLDLIHNKHIPDQYKYNTRQVRLETLAGLIDTDGHLVKGTAKCYEYVTKLDRLKDDIVYLCRSLGFGVTARKAVKGIKSTGFKGEYWRLYITGNLSEVPVLLPRKKVIKNSRQRNALNTGFKVIPKGYGEYFGFAVNKNHLFLLGDFTVVHNTRSLINIACGLVKRKVNVLVFTLEVPKEQYLNLCISCFCNLAFSDVRDRKLSAGDWFMIERIKKQMDSGEWGNLTIVDSLGSCTPEYIDAQIDELQLKTGIAYDVIVVDHGTMMRASYPTGKDNIDQGAIAEDLRAIARKRSVTVLAAVQRKVAEKKSGRRGGNSGDQKEAEAGGEAIGRSFIWFQTADIVMIIQNEQPDDTDGGVSTLRYKVISRYGPSSSFELIKDFGKTQLLSVKGNTKLKGMWEDNSLG